jgi:hypothetical protein
MTGVGYHISQLINIRKITKEKQMNMNLGDADDYRELNVAVKNYVVAEFVSVPENFKIESHLHLRESFGIFKTKDINLAQVKTISDFVRCSPVTSLMNNPVIDPKSCMFFLSVLEELDLVLTNIYNPIRREWKEYSTFVNLWEKDRGQLIRGQEVYRISFLIVNIVHFLKEDIIDQAIKQVEDIQKYQQEIEEAKRVRF